MEKCSLGSPASSEEGSKQDLVQLESNLLPLPVVSLNAGTTGTTVPVQEVQPVIKREMSGAVSAQIQRNTPETHKIDHQPQTAR